MSDDDRRLPVGVLTGFLGSGKTTLLKRWLQGEESADAVGETAVLINEFGAVGLDHLLVGRIDAETVLLDNGCVCCAIRGELKEALLRLHARVLSGELQPFRRVIIETTGLAAPGPVLATLLADSQLRHHFRPAFVCTVVDAVHAARQQERHPEWTAQIAAADTLCLSKLDLGDPAQATATQCQLTALNPLAAVVDAAKALPPWYASRTAGLEGDWAPRVAAGTLSETAPHAPRRHAHTTSYGGANAFCLTFDKPLEWFTLILWLTLLLHRHGESILRLKGILNIATEGWPEGQPTVLHGIGHLMHPPDHLEHWPDADPRSRLVFITQGLEETQVRASWDAFELFYAEGGDGGPYILPLTARDSPIRLDRQTER